MSDAPDSSFLDAEVESGLAPLRAMGVSPAMLEEAANLLRMALADHPTGRYLMSRARPRTVATSGPTVVEPLDGVAQDAPARVRGSR